jgi:hypothetical protein
MYTLEEGKEAVRLARSAVDAFVTGSKVVEKEISPSFEKFSGVFVTLNTYPKKKLRGCIGLPEPVVQLKKAIIEAAKSACMDPRFPPLSPSELDATVVEVTILTPMELINVGNPREYPKKIRVGEDGLMVKKSYYSGLLLPQVPVEWNWDEKEFLRQACMKAGLMADEWLEGDVDIYSFHGQIFTEVTPRGEVIEKTLK